MQFKYQVQYRHIAKKHLCFMGSISNNYQNHVKDYSSIMLYGLHLMMHTTLRWLLLSISSIQEVLNKFVSIKDSTKTVPVTMKMDPKGFFVYWINQSKVGKSQQHSDVWVKYMWLGSAKGVRYVSASFTTFWPQQSV